MSQTNNEQVSFSQCPAEQYADFDEATANQTSLYHPVNRPEHYAAGKFEVITIIADQLGDEGLRGFCLGNALKYICRAGKKNPQKELEDLEKASWYLSHYEGVLRGK